MKVFRPVGGWLESLCWRVMELPPGKDLEHPSDVLVVLGSLSVDDG